MVNVNLKGKDTVIDLSQDAIEEITLNTEEFSVEFLKSETGKKIIIKLAESVYFALINYFKEE